MMVIHKDHFVPVADSVRIEVVRISYSQVRVSPHCSSLGHTLEGNRSGELGNSHCFLSSPGNWPWFPRAPASNSDSDHDYSGFCLVS